MVVVILDSDQIPEGISSKLVRYPNESQEQFYGRVTHLHHQNQKICQIGDLSSVRNLTVLYLYDNRIEKIEHLRAVPQLQMLYLQGNKISVIENLSHLKKLKKLYLSNNRISIVENLDDLSNLEELHIDHQKLNPDQNLVFDPRSCVGLKSLKVLNSSHNQMLDLHPLELLIKLETLNVSHNLIDDLPSAIDILRQMVRLSHLNLQGNPITSTLRYRETLIGSCGTNIGFIDGKPVNSNCRIMLMNLHKAKCRAKSCTDKSSSSSSEFSPVETPLNSDSHLAPS